MNESLNPWRKRRRELCLLVRNIYAISAKGFNLPRLHGPFPVELDTWRLEHKYGIFQAVLGALTEEFSGFLGARF